MRVVVFRICRGSWERVEVGTWLANLYTRPHPRVRELMHATIDQEPTPAARNHAVEVARSAKADVLVMVDDDMVPAEGFFDSAIDHLRDHPGAVVIGSPYCGARAGGCAVQVMQRPVSALVAKPGEQSELFMERVEREDAAKRKGIELVHAVGTGLLACNMAAFDALAEPYFDYEYTTPSRSNVALTEDFYFTRDLSTAGGRVYVDWDHWSSHAKVEIVGKPE